MTHDEIQDLLEGYVDETLDRPTRREVDAHLASCDECRALLEGVAPVDLGDVERRPWAEADMRRAVRRSMLRVAGDALLLGLAVLLALWSLSFLVLQPLVINRGQRAVAATIATLDLAVMLNPGGFVPDYLYQSHFASRTTQAQVSIPIGSGTRELGEVESVIGIVSFGGPNGWFNPYLGDDVFASGDEESLAAASEGTVSTVQLRFDPALDLEAAEALSRPESDVSITWAGFAVGLEGSNLTPTGILGYGTCGDRPFIEASAWGGGGSGHSLNGPTSVSAAAEATKMALSNLVDRPELLEGIGSNVEEGRTALAGLETPRVGSLVVTGPSTEVLDFLDVAAPASMVILGIDFFNWSQPPCGR